MHPVHASCTTTTKNTPQEIAAIVLDLSKWPLFTGYGPLPGIRSATFQTQTPEIVGTIIAVINTDNSKHTEEIITWDIPNTISFRLTNFSRPLSFIATHFIESMHFKIENDDANEPCTHLTRTMDLYPRFIITRPILWLIRPLLRRAVERSNETLL